ncbi:two-component sensor histidine kinase [Salinivibrio proteolyticus]|uniref:HAMP domain-containing sensor histidine kinase n=1 Tax=Salinivibrio proteolyticus TaxID=334715 RepID=UPI000988F863|nr:ATP-binding protein [Salinivibrio proteolyticus]OOF27511.1 two-component sensor histidine kinase [Salinivibrio proteolyticus]
MSLRLKTILGVALIEAILLAILLTLTLNYLETTNYQGLNQRASSTTQLFASTVKNAVLSFDLATVDSFTQELLHNSDIIYVAVVGDDGRVLSSAGDLPASFTTDILEINAQSVTDGLYDVRATISESNIEFGSVWIGFDLTSLLGQIKDAKNWSMLIVLGEMLLVALFSYLLGNYLTQRLSELKNAANTIASGERDVRISTHGKDELASVAAAFSNMITALRESENKTATYQKRLEEANQTLESKVARRTADLVRSNDQLREINHQLKQTQEKLVESEKMASIGTMAAGVAHEINNPIGAVKSNLKMCQEYLDTYQKWTEIAEHVIHQSEPLETLTHWKNRHYVDDLYDDFNDSLADANDCVQRVINIVSALQQYSSYNQQTRQHFQGVEIFTVIDEALNTLSPPTNIKISIAANVYQLPRVMGRYDELVMLFKEVIKNAQQACERGTPDVAHSIDVEGEDNGESCTITVKDSGPGLPHDQSHRVYDPFFTTLPVGQGMGLGLTYVYDIVRHHQGDIQLTSSVHGTTAAITLLRHKSDAIANHAS